MRSALSNKNLTLYIESDYSGFPIQIEKGPFIQEYLYRLLQTIIRSTDQYREVFTFRFDLRLPSGHLSDLSYQNEAIHRFVDSFKAKIDHNRQMTMRNDRYARDSIVRYVWAREFGQHGRPHYHFAIFLNKDAYFTLGRKELGIDNMFNRLNAAWASALRIPTDAAIGLVHIPENPCYYLRRNDPTSIAPFFFRASYLCKASTKAFGDGGHGFGASRL